MKTRLVAMCAGLLMACGGGDDGGSSPGPDAPTSEPQINGLPAPQFYAQLAYETTHTAASGAAAFPTTDGRDAFVAYVFLLPGGELELFYAEGQGDVSTTGWSINVDASTKKRRTGTWKVEGAKLVLGSWMSCDGFEVNGKPALRCALTSSIVSSAAVGHAGTFSRDFATLSPDDSEFADYAP